MIKVKWLKAHNKFSYVAGDVGYVTPVWAEILLAQGYILPVPDAVTELPESAPVNTLPEDLPARDKLFAAGFDSIEKVKEAGDSLLDVIGISNNILKKITKYLKDK
jgi:hypothetical protein